MNVIDWIRESSIYLSSVSPDVWSVEKAAEWLSDGMEYLRAANVGPVSSLMTGGHCLTRIAEDEETEEFILMRQISSYINFHSDDGVLVYGHTEDVSLPGVDSPTYDLLD